MTDHAVYIVEQTSPSSTVVGFDRLNGSLMRSGSNLAVYAEYPFIPKSISNVIYTSLNLGTIGQQQNSFTGAYGRSMVGPDDEIKSYYSRLMDRQETLGGEFEKVLSDHLWDLYSQ